MKKTTTKSLGQYSMKKNHTYKSIWRWHFYAGIIFAPILLLLAVTGAVYLFKPEIEQTLYADFYAVTPQEYRLPASEQFKKVQSLYPNALITAYRPGEDKTRSNEIHVTAGGESFAVFTDPYTGKVIGELKDDERIMDQVEKLHGELMAGKTGDRIIELAACWAIVLIVTGLYLWLPKNRRNFKGILFPRFTKGKRVLQRDLHAVPAFWISAGMLFLILTGLPWSGFWGTNFQAAVTNSGAGYPPSVWVGDAPASNTKTEDIAEVPWAAENLDVPLSELNGLIPQPIDAVIEIAEREQITPGYTVYIPQEPTGVYTLSVFSPKAQDEATMHIDQYTGAVLADYRYDNYGWLGKVIAWGITLHKGTQFGMPNQLIGLLVCVGIVFTITSGLYLWWKRKPEKGLGAPAAPPAFQQKPVILLLVIFGVMFPLAGLSFLAIWLLDFLVIRQIPAVKKYLNA